MNKLTVSGVFIIVLILRINSELAVAFDDVSDIERCGPFVPQLDNLPDDIKPIHYDVFLSVFNVEMMYRGQVRMLLATTTLRTSFMVLHAAPDIEINRLQVYNVDNLLNQDELPVKCTSVNPNQGLLIVEFETYVVLGPRLLLTANFVAPIRHQSVGLFLFEDDNVLLTKLESNLTRYLMPSFDESRFKATFKLSVEVAVGQTCLFITTAETTQPSLEYPGNRIITTFSKTDNIAPHQLSFVIGSLTPVWEGKNNWNIRMFELSASRVQATSQEQIENAIERVSTFFRMPYPSQKLDIVQLGPWPRESLVPILDNIGIAVMFMISANSSEDMLLITFLRLIARHYLQSLLDLELPQDLWLLDGLSLQFAFDGLFRTTSIVRLNGRSMIHLHRYSIEYFLKDSAVQIFDENLRPNNWNDNHIWKLVAIFKNLNRMCGSRAWNNIFRDLAAERLNGTFNNQRNFMTRLSEACRFNPDIALINSLTKPGVSILNTYIGRDRTIRLEHQRLLIRANQPTALVCRDGTPINLHTSALFTIKKFDNTDWGFKLFREDGLIKPPKYNAPREMFPCVKLNHDGTGFFLVKYSKDLIQRYYKHCNVMKSLTLLDRSNLIFDSIVLYKAGLVDITYPLDFLIITKDEKNLFNNYEQYRSFSYLNRLFRGDEEMSFIMREFGKLLFDHIKIDEILQIRQAPKIQKYMIMRDFAEFLLLADSKETMIKVNNFVATIFDRLEVTKLNPSVVQPVLFLLAKRNSIETLINSHPDLPAECLGRALALLGSEDLLMRAWIWLLGTKKDRDAVVGFLLQSIEAIRSREFISQHLSDEIKMVQLVTFLGPSRSRRILREFCVLPQDSHLCFMTDVVKEKFSHEDWARVESDIEKLTNEYRRLNLANLDIFRSKIYALIGN